MLGLVMLDRSAFLANERMGQTSSTFITYTQNMSLRRIAITGPFQHSRVAPAFVPFFCSLLLLLVSSAFLQSLLCITQDESIRDRP